LTAGEALAFSGMQGAAVAVKRAGSKSAAWKRSRSMAVGAFAVMASSLCAGAGAPPQDSIDPAILANLDRIRETAKKSDWAWEQLEDLADQIGPRLSGSPQSAAAVSQVAAALRAVGARVTLQPVQVPHWVRGEEQAELTDYAGRRRDTAPAPDGVGWILGDPRHGAGTARDRGARLQ
jgi:hypothetical protein